MDTVEIFETTNRDGEQATQGFLNGAQSKLEIARKLAELNVNTIEAGFPRSSQNDFEAVELIAKEVRGPYIAGLARVVPVDIERAWDAIKYAEKPTLHTFSVMINREALAAYGKEMPTIIDESFKGVQLARKLVGSRGRVEFSAQNAVFALYEALIMMKDPLLEAEGVRQRQFILDLYGAAVKAGADVLNIPDTEGRMLPEQTQQIFREYISHVPGAQGRIFSAHCHNDLGLAVANSLAAVRAGARQVECTINGIGERAGNAALEEVTMALWTHRDSLDVSTGIRTELLNELSKVVSYHTGLDVQSNKAIVGSNALVHSSGIHQDGNIKGQKSRTRIYQIFDPETVGWTGESNQLTSRSGKQGVKLRLDRIGYHFTLDEVDTKVMSVYKHVADERKVLNDIDLRAIMGVVYPLPQQIEYISHSVYKELRDPEYHARVCLKVGGQEITSNWALPVKDARLEGAVDAICTAIDSVTAFKKGDIPVLVWYETKNVGKRHSAEGEVTVVLGKNGHQEVWDQSVHLSKSIFVGRARHKDVPTASAMAYVQALNEYAHSLQQPL